MVLKYNRLVIVLSVVLVAACSDNSSQPAPKQDASIDVGADSASDVGDLDAGTDADAEVDAGPAVLRVQPSQLVFSNVQIGQSKTASISLSNVGQSTLYITRAELTERDTQDTPEIKQGADWPQDNLAIEPGTFATLNVLYEPADYKTDSGFVTISATDPDNSQVVVPINTINSYPDIDVPKTIRLGTVAVGDTATQKIAIYNRGLSPLTVNDITMAGDNSFSIQVESPYSTPAVIDTDDYIIFDLTYAPSTTDTANATITIDSNDPDEGSYDIGVVGNEPTPCIQVSSPSLDFGDVAVGQQQTKSLTVLNCSQSRQLHISQIALSTDGGGAFTIDDAPDTPAVIPPATTTTIKVAAKADDARQALGILDIASDDPQQGGLTVDLRASFVAQ